MRKLRKRGSFRWEKAFYSDKAMLERDQFGIFASPMAVCSGKPEKLTMSKEIVGGLLANHAIVSLPESGGTINKWSSSHHRSWSL